nr:hypothetical protein [Streptofilum sp. BC4-VF8pt]WKT08700.1 hypothetical protein [Streptofilum sp. ZNP2-VF4pt]
MKRKTENKKDLLVSNNDFSFFQTNFQLFRLLLKQGVYEFKQDVFNSSIYAIKKQIIFFTFWQWQDAALTTLLKRFVLKDSVSIKLYGNLTSISQLIQRRFKLFFINQKLLPVVLRVIPWGIIAITAYNVKSRCSKGYDFHRSHYRLTCQQFCDLSCEELSNIRKIHVYPNGFCVLETSKKNLVTESNNFKQSIFFLNKNSELYRYSLKMPSGLHNWNIFTNDGLFLNPNIYSALVNQELSKESDEAMQDFWILNDSGFSMNFDEIDNLLIDLDKSDDLPRSSIRSILEDFRSISSLERIEQDFSDSDLFDVKNRNFNFWKTGKAFLSSFSNIIKIQTQHNLSNSLIGNTNFDLYTKEDNQQQALNKSILNDQQLFEKQLLIHESSGKVLAAQNAEKNLFDTSPAITDGKLNVLLTILSGDMLSRQKINKQKNVDVIKNKFWVPNIYTDNDMFVQQSFSRLKNVFLPIFNQPQTDYEEALIFHSIDGSKRYHKRRQIQQALKFKIVNHILNANNNLTEQFLRPLFPINSLRDFRPGSLNLNSFNTSSFNQTTLVLESFRTKPVSTIQYAPYILEKDILDNESSTLSDMSFDFLLDSNKITPTVSQINEVLNSLTFLSNAWEEHTFHRKLISLCQKILTLLCETKMPEDLQQLLSHHSVITNQSNLKDQWIRYQRITALKRVLWNLNDFKSDIRADKEQHEQAASMLRDKNIAGKRLIQPRISKKLKLRKKNELERVQKFKGIGFADLKRQQKNQTPSSILEPIYQPEKALKNYDNLSSAQRDLSSQIKLEVHKGLEKSVFEKAENFRRSSLFKYLVEFLADGAKDESLGWGIVNAFESGQWNAPIIRHQKALSSSKGSLQQALQEPRQLWRVAVFHEMKKQLDVRQIALQKLMKPKNSSTRRYKNVIQILLDLIKTIQKGFNDGLQDLWFFTKTDIAVNIDCNLAQTILNLSKPEMVKDLFLAEDVLKQEPKQAFKNHTSTELEQLTLMEIERTTNELCDLIQDVGRNLQIHRVLQWHSQLSLAFTNLFNEFNRILDYDENVLLDKREYTDSEFSTANELEDWKLKQSKDAKRFTTDLEDSSNKFQQNGYKFKDSYSEGNDLTKVIQYEGVNLVNFNFQAHVLKGPTRLSFFQKLKKKPPATFVLQLFARFFRDVLPWYEILDTSSWLERAVIGSVEKLTNLPFLYQKKAFDISNNQDLQLHNSNKDPHKTLDNVNTFDNSVELLSLQALLLEPEKNSRNSEKSLADLNQTQADWISALMETLRQDNLFKKLSKDLPTKNGDVELKTKTNVLKDETYWKDLLYPHAKELITHVLLNTLKDRTKTSIQNEHLKRLLILKQQQFKSLQMFE